MIKKISICKKRDCQKRIKFQIIHQAFFYKMRPEKCKVYMSSNVMINDNKQV